MGIAKYQHPWDTKQDAFRSDYASKYYYRLFNLITEDLHYTEKQKVKTRVNAVNEYVKQLGKPLLFTNPQDTYQTAWEYYELMRFHYKEDFTQKYADLIKLSKKRILEINHIKWRSAL